MSKIIAKLYWEPNAELKELHWFTGYEGKSMYALTRKSDFHRAGYIISYIGQTKIDVIKEIMLQSNKKRVTGFQIIDVKINGNLNPGRLTLIETALIHYAREIHGWAKMNINQIGPPKKDIRIDNTGYKHPKFHRRFDIIEQEIKTFR